MSDKNKSKYSTYKNGLRIGDLVEYKFHIFGKNMTTGYKMTSIVLDRKHLFNKETRWGIKSFYEYRMMSLDPKFNQKTFKTKTQNITVINVTSIKEG